MTTNYYADRAKRLLHYGMAQDRAVSEFRGNVMPISSYRPINATGEIGLTQWEFPDFSRLVWVGGYTYAALEPR
jgi:hypothetical protein